MKPWDRFLSEINGQSQIFIIGPMAHAEVPASGATVYVDGGTAAEPASPAPFPVIRIGDGDSGAGLLDVTLPQDKDFSDLAFVLQSLPAHIDRVEMVGFLGGRRDHELMNFGEVHAFLKTRTRFTRVNFDDSVIAFVGGPLELEIEGLFSVLVFEESSVRLTGACKFPLQVPTLLAPASSRGLSNEGQGLIKCESSKPCFVFVP